MDKGPPVTSVSLFRQPHCDRQRPKQEPESCPLDRQAAVGVSGDPENVLLVGARLEVIDHVVERWRALGEVQEDG